MERHWLRLSPDFPQEGLVGFEADLSSPEKTPSAQQYQIRVRGYVPETGSVAEIRQAAILRLWTILRDQLPPDIAPHGPGA